VASGIRREGGNVLLYRSKDLRRWEYLHPLASGKWTGHESVNPVDSGEMWECPDFFALGGKHVLLYSTAGGVYWETGLLDPKQLVFHSEKRGILDHGAYYAQKTQLDFPGNRILWGWIPEKRPDDALRAAGWAGCMSLPRVLLLNDDGELQMRFAPNVQSLRGKKFGFPKGNSAVEVRAAAAERIRIENVAGEFAWTAAAPNAKFTLSDDTGPWVCLAVEAVNDSSARLTVNGKSVDLVAAAKAEHTFHLFLDGSVAELISDQQHAITSRIYRRPDGPLRISAVDSDLGQLTSLEAWQLRAISPDRLTT
jgi:beta-fructofuranosidase